MLNPFLKPDGISSWKWHFLMFKRYFDTGYGITGYIKYLIALFGLSSLDVLNTLILGFVYAILCFVIGYLWYKKSFVEVDNEISNRFNLFMREMRDMKDKIENAKKITSKKKI